MLDSNNDNNHMNHISQIINTTAASAVCRRCSAELESNISTNINVRQGRIYCVHQVQRTVG